MEISQADRLILLNEIAKDAGLSERDDDEFTARELADYYNTYVTILPQYLDFRNIKYTRRKAIANGRKRFVYKLERSKA